MTPGNSPSQPGNYTRFKGTRSGIFTEQSIHYDETGLILASTGITTETYKKVSFKDVCGFSRCVSSRRETIAGITGIIAGIFLLILLGQGFDVPALWVILAFFVALFIANIVKGPGCKCVLSTAYSSIPLSGITRMKQAEKFQSLLEQKVSSTQGLISAEDIDRLEKERKIQNAPSASAANPVSDNQIAADPHDTEAAPELELEGAAKPAEAPPLRMKEHKPPPIPKGDGVRKIHYILPFTALLLAISSLLNAFFPGYPIAISALLYVGAFIGAAFGLSRRVQRPGGEQIQKTAMASVVYFVIGMVIAYFTWIFTAVSGFDSYEASQHDPLRLVDTSHPAFFTLFLVNGIACICFALSSYVGINKSR